MSLKILRTGEVISIHALREEGDPRRAVPPALIGVFLSTPSARRATGNANVFLGADKFLSTPSARRATASKSQTPRPQ